MLLTLLGCQESPRGISVSLELPTTLSRSNVRVRNLKAHASGLELWIKSEGAGKRYVLPPSKWDRISLSAPSDSALEITARILAFREGVSVVLLSGGKKFPSEQLDAGEPLSLRLKLHVPVREFD